MAKRGVCLRRFMQVLAGVGLVTAARAEDDLPRRVQGEAVEVEPKLMLTEGLEGLLPAEANAVWLPSGVDVQRLEAEWATARKSAAAGQRLFKSGILAKVEAEKRELKAIRLEAQLAAARQDVAAKALEAARAALATGGATKDQLPSAEAALVDASAKAAETLGNLRRAELEAAELNLFRQRKLVAAGIGRKAHVKRAEEQLAALRSRQESPVSAPAEGSTGAVREK